MYRAVAWFCLDRGIDLADREAVAQAAQDLDLDLGTDPAGATVAVAGTDITAEIRTERISEQVSTVATNTMVRTILQGRQRELLHATAAERGFCVAEGRDITTVVAPDAQVRVLLLASDEERMRRRAVELQLEDTEETRERMADQVLRRDRDDSTVSEFLTAAEGVETVDTTGLEIEDVVEKILMLVAAAESAQESRCTAGPSRPPTGATWRPSMMPPRPHRRDIESPCERAFPTPPMTRTSLDRGEEEQPGPRFSAIFPSSPWSPPERRQVHSGQPYPGPPRGGRRGPSRVTGTGCSTRPSGLARTLAGRHRGWRSVSRAWPTAYEQAEVAVSLADVVMFVVMRTWASPPRGSCLGAAQIEGANRAGRQQGGRSAR